MVDSKTILSVNRLTIERDKFILDHIDWSVQKGENWVILGPNGSGKTSLLKSIVGYFPPTSGSISVLGKVFGRSNWNELRLRIGLVSQLHTTTYRRERARGGCGRIWKVRTG